MDDHAGPEPEPDLAILERIESELFAVQRALEQIDDGVYEGFRRPRRAAQLADH